MRCSLVILSAFILATFTVVSTAEMPQKSELALPGVSKRQLSSPLGGRRRRVKHYKGKGKHKKHHKKSHRKNHGLNNIRPIGMAGTTSTGTKALPGKADAIASEFRSDV
ncbi:hypothetical protein K501DRAFT_267887 [Backusella circina FSU 941]|nr:hypothetical protein K501DRAFT_267887 [Backusella circina FSU 941]